ncbi:hypothetical protein CFO_g2710 [Ceratocystis platani]|uniref:Extracellular serine-rich protein n=1 Tax=Ceratocystis fimbriata f. sp. platani TaxID=88771 RepID=A0A0F8B1B7_CERFI|nr:hypothetical protein CFO_g2710 [Ceratocystis platani]
MRFSSVLLAIAAATGLTSAKTIVVKLTDKNTFDPREITADSGDFLEFQFGPANHSVAMGDFNAPGGPCVPINNGGFWSGYVPVGSGLAQTAFRVKLNNTDPLVFYSTQGRECNFGMVGVVNGRDNQTYAKYADRASKIADSIDPHGGPFGGVFADRDQDKSSSSSSNNNNNNNNSNNNKNNNNKSAAVSLQATTILVVVASLMVLAVLA